MPDDFDVSDADVRCSSARAVIADNSTAGRAVAASPDANRCAQRDAGTSSPNAAGTVMPNASAATATDAAKVPSTAFARTVKDLRTSGWAVVSSTHTTTSWSGYGSKRETPTP